jgi:hypothetical protein
VRAAVDLPADEFEASGARAEAQEVERRLCRGRGVSLRLPGGEVIRLAGTPATIGRDGLCEVVLRDPGVSRRHAVIVSEGAGLAIGDAGSRGGTRLGPAAIAGRLSLTGDGQVGLGEHSQLRFQVVGPATVALTGLTGLDRTLRAYVGSGPVQLGPAIAGAEGLALRFDGGTCRLERPLSLPVRVAGRLVGAGCDLLHGDVIEVLPSGLRLEVP